MEKKILWIGFPDENGSLDKPSLEALTAARLMAEGIGAELVAGLIGRAVPDTSSRIGGAGATRVLCVSGEAWAAPRYATDVAACERIAREVGAEVIVAAGGSRFSRISAGLAQRLGGAADNQITEIATEGGTLAVSRWFYRQRMIGKLRRVARPWVLSIAPGSFAPAEAGDATVTPIEGQEVESRTTVIGIEAGTTGAQTIRPDAETLLVAGAGWTKRQGDGQVHADAAGALILAFLEQTRASLGSSKSMVDLSLEGQDVLPFLTHLHQIGQTGSSPRHAKGLATCCHGEEPHAVGWRFIKERRAINTDANCGWAQGKADVLYVADAFEVMGKVNQRLAE